MAEDTEQGSILNQTLNIERHQTVPRCFKTFKYQYFIYKLFTVKTGQYIGVYCIIKSDQYHVLKELLRHTGPLILDFCNIRADLDCIPAYLTWSQLSESVIKAIKMRL